ncbi:MAG: hypothetical protein R6V23_16975, partial [Bacteroidales bacterium]
RYNSKPLLSFKMGQLYDLYLQNKKLALTYYDGYLTMMNDSNDQNANPDSIAAYDLSIKEYVEERVRILKEALFFEGGQ